MIVKNGAPVLARCLASAAPFVDRIVVGDTGSTDDSIAIARQFGAEIFSIPWEQDFAAARNRLLAERKCDWILVLDADEMLAPAAGPEIRALIENPNVWAYHNPRWNYMRDMSKRLGFETAKPNPHHIEEARAFPAYVPLPTTRLFRSHPEIYYEGCVHETITRRLGQFGLPTARAQFVVHHFGHAEDAEADREQKDTLYQALTERKLEANPNDPQILIELGFAELEHSHRPAAAFMHFSRACQLSPHSSVAWLFSAACLIRLNKLAEAHKCLDQCAELGMRNALYYQTLGDAHFHAGHYVEAHASYAQGVALGESSPLCEAKLGACEIHLGSPQQGLRRMQDAIYAAPAFGELYDILATAALLAGDLALASLTAQARLRLGNPTDFHHQLAGLLENQQRAQNERITLSA